MNQAPKDSRFDTFNSPWSWQKWFSKTLQGFFYSIFGISHLHNIYVCTDMGILCHCNYCQVEFNVSKWLSFGAGFIEGLTPELVFLNFDLGYNFLHDISFICQFCFYVSRWGWPCSQVGLFISERMMKFLNQVRESQEWNF